MDANQVAQTVMEVVAKVAKKDSAELTTEARIAEDLGLKSMARIEVAALIEDATEVFIDNFEIRNPKTVAELIDLVASKL